MKKLTLNLAIAAVLSCAPSLKAGISIGHIEPNTTTGEFLDSSGATLNAGGVSIGYFPTPPANTAFGTTITTWGQVLAAGYTDLRTIPGVTISTGPNLDWDFPLPVSGTVSNIPITTVPQNTQLYFFAFNGGSFNLATPSASFAGSTQWAVVADNADLTPADNGSKSLLLNTVAANEVLVGTDNVNNVNLALLAPVPEPGTITLGAMAVFSRLGSRRRQRR